MPDNNHPGSFRQILNQFINDLQRLVEISYMFEAQDIAVHLNELISRVENHSFKIAVVGEFKRGKSTFINALLGAPILPADIAPTSATLNRITYGQNPSATLYFKDNLKRPAQKIKIENLSEYVTKLTPVSEEVAFTIKEAVITYPAPFCKNNVDIVDTPGLQDEGGLTTVTLNVLKNVDVAIMVVMADSPFSETEGNFLDRILVDGLQKVIFVITAIDRIKVEDRQKVIDTITSRINNRIKSYAEEKYKGSKSEIKKFITEFGKPNVFALSGQLALDGKMSGDSTSLSESGYENFEKELDRFLTFESESLGLKTKFNQLRLLINDLLLTIGKKKDAILQHPALFNQEYKIVGTFLELLEQIGQTVIGKIQERASTSTKLCKNILDSMTNEFENTSITKLINQATIIRDQLDYSSKYNSLVNSLTQSIEKSTIEIADKNAQRICEQVHADIYEATTELDEYSITYDRIMLHIDGILDRVSPDGAISKLRKPKLPKDISEGFSKLRADLKKSSIKSIYKELSKNFYLGTKWIDLAFTSSEVKSNVLIPEDEYFRRLTFFVAGVYSFKESLINSCIYQIRKLEIKSANALPAVSTGKFINNSFDDLIKVIRTHIQASNDVVNKIQDLGEKVNTLVDNEINEIDKLTLEVIDVKNRLITM